MQKKYNPNIHLHLYNILVSIFQVLVCYIWFSFVILEYSTKESEVRFLYTGRLFYLTYCSPLEGVKGVCSKSGTKDHVDKFSIHSQLNNCTEWNWSHSHQKLPFRAMLVFPFISQNGVYVSQIWKNSEQMVEDINHS